MGRAGVRLVLGRATATTTPCGAGLSEAQGEYIVLAESDGTLMDKDVLKFLAYADNFDLVLGTLAVVGLWRPSGWRRPADLTARAGGTQPASPVGDYARLSGLRRSERARQSATTRGP